MAGINFLYYCSVMDVKDEIFDSPDLTQDAHKPYDDRRIMRFIAKAYAEINGALKAGGYDVPITNSTKTLTLADEKADSINQVVIGVTAGDGANFEPGDTVRIHGKSTTLYNDEFVGIVNVSTDNLTVQYLENDYNVGSTVELCTEGALYVKSCNALGAAAKILLSKAARQDENKNKEIGALLKEYHRCLEQLRKGEIVLDGLTTGGSVISTYFVDNSDATDVADRTATMIMEF